MLLPLRSNTHNTLAPGNTKFLDLAECIASDPKGYQQVLKHLCFLVESGTLVPKISEKISIEDVADAHRYLQTGKSNGTIVCLPEQPDKP